VLFRSPFSGYPQYSDLGGSKKQAATSAKLVVEKFFVRVDVTELFLMRKKTPSFIAEFPLATTPADDRELSIRLDAARQIYNASLGESLRRLDLMRESKAWQAAQAMPKHSSQAIDKAKTSTG
jgi:hypothetical protein